ncbi:MAG: hypothetical protein ACFFFB_12560, partial [Candidatus Heimdallarchaeota archaeon]
SNEAVSIVKHIYVSQMIKTKEVSNDIIRFLVEIENLNDFETFLNKEISTNLKMGCPAYPRLEEKLKAHLKNLLIS